MARQHHDGEPVTLEAVEDERWEDEAPTAAETDDIAHALQEQTEDDRSDE